MERPRLIKVEWADIMAADDKEIPQGGNLEGDYEDECLSCNLLTLMGENNYGMTAKYPIFDPKEHLEPARSNQQVFVIADHVLNAEQCSFFGVGPAITIDRIKNYDLSPFIEAGYKRFLVVGDFNNREAMEERFALLRLSNFNCEMRLQVGNYND